MIELALNVAAFMFIAWVALIIFGLIASLFDL